MKGQNKKLKRMNLKFKIFNFTAGSAVPRLGLGGGLTLLWANSVDLDIQTSSPHHIGALKNQDGAVWRFYWFGIPSVLPLW